MECHCIIYHPDPTDHDERDRAMEMARSGDRTTRLVGLAMLGPCPDREV